MNHIDVTEVFQTAANFADKYITKTAIFDYLERIIEQLRGASHPPIPASQEGASPQQEGASSQ